MYLDITQKAREDESKSKQKSSVSAVKKHTFFLDGNLLNVDEQRKLNEFYEKNDAHWKLIYKAKRDGFRGRNFHSQCDTRGPTMTIIKSKGDGYVFGGYTACPWSLDDGRKTDPTAFLFTIRNPHGLEMTKFKIGQHLSGQ